jgi:hypothetical protein
MFLNYEIALIRHLRREKKRLHIAVDSGVLAVLACLSPLKRRARETE